MICFPFGETVITMFKDFNCLYNDIIHKKRSIIWVLRSL